MWSTIQVICVSLISLEIFGYCPFAIYTSCKFYKLSFGKQEQFLLVRRPMLTILINGFLIAVCMLQHPYLAIFHVCHLSNPDPTMDYNRIDWIVELFCQSFLLLSFTLICVKIYLSYYIQQLNLSLVNYTWQKEINVGVSGLSQTISTHPIKYIICIHLCIVYFVLRMVDT